MKSSWLDIRQVKIDCRNCRIISRRWARDLLRLKTIRLKGVNLRNLMLTETGSRKNCRKCLVKLKRSLVVQIRMQNIILMK